LVSLGFIWTHFDSLGLTCNELIWIHLDSLGLTLDSLELIWTHLDSMGTHLDSLRLTTPHKGKGKASWGQRDKGKAPTPDFEPGSH